METPKYLQTLWAYKWLLLFGAVVAAAAAFFAGFQIQDGQVVSRTAKTYSAATTMLVTSPTQSMYQSETQAETVPEGGTPPVNADLAQSALLYAYMITGDEIRSEVEASVGPLDEDTESITALRRTTQPAGDERFPGRYELPVLEAVGIAATPERAEEISRAAATAFQSYLVEQQDSQQIAENQRTSVEPLAEGKAVEGDGSNPAIPVVVTFFGVFLAFVVLAFVVAGIRSGARKRRAADDTAGAAGETDTTGTSIDAVEDVPTDDAATDEEPGGERTRSTRRERGELVTAGTHDEN
ncbi:hypothetical protein [Microbacterium sp. bgisy203]|uniref:hypothetical protein n=1 Tax=Microbacterium sp. bgisy203 TaxID=3413799 RepID=UPI003D7290F1